jgi:RimJ/RimL family protein N-acetyltransferase
VGIERHDDPAAYAARVLPLLLRDEARFNLEIAVISRAAEGFRYPAGDAGPDEEPLLLTVDGMPAVRTPPHNLLMAPVPATAAPALAAYLRDTDLPGALGAPDAVTAFAEAYGRPFHVSRQQGVYELRELVPPARPAPGVLRVADDWPLVERWAREFTDEVGLPRQDLTSFRARYDEGLIWVWVDGEPVCLAGCGGFTPNGARVGPVYTPPALRGRGYASAATAAVTRELLGRGRTSTFLYTDLANPTSNRIYQAIGYRHVTDVREVTFGR